jgi:tetratricopeptide (TPR) repeat protein
MPADALTPNLAAAELYLVSLDRMTKEESILRRAFVYLGRAVRLLAVVSILFYLAPSELKAEDKAPGDQAIQRHLTEGKRLGKDGEYEQAIAEFNKILKLDPKNVHALNNLGVVYFKLNDLDTAISYYTKAIDSGVANATTYFFRGILFEKYRGEQAKAVKDYSKAVQLQPKFTKAYLNRASAYSSLKEYGKAVADYNTVVQIRPSSEKMVLAKRAKAYFKKGEYTKAWADVEKAKELGVKLDEKFVQDVQKAIQKK